MCPSANDPSSFKILTRVCTISDLKRYVTSEVIKNHVTSRQVNNQLESHIRRSERVEMMINPSLEQITQARRNLRSIDAAPKRRHLATAPSSQPSNSSENWASTSRAEKEERCYDPNDTTFTFFDGEDDMDFELEDYKSLRAKMSCGHTVTPTSLIKWCRRQLDQGKAEFVCGQPGCNVVWSCEEVCKMALLTPAETKDIENTMFKRAAKYYMDAKKCPSCKSLVLREDQSNLRVFCTVCTRNKRKIYEFCWQCLKEWTGPSQQSDHCAHPDCIGRPQEILRKCPEITFKEVKNVTGCPSVRACPTCGKLIEHNTMNCKSIICPRCKVKFCFVCIKLATVCGPSYKACISGVAPRQTSIPVWKRK